ncbi:MAG: hypothetical protein HN981_00280 [Candidatus Pacebacteria bacterium]|jgi:hypothetical protein|nr:hypothetical protein [Candidatus Paceibacterota bacterium]MBT4651971.1 hypothetical protein [Candidatus Paceibacterota bacterium]MBT6755993.1 hypothetical protein [Candidatus Paceibacterota bacterium]MBT6920819.1 hypothetical protein [Candidatus Paceibacterota bacterium]
MAKKRTKAQKKNRKHVIQAQQKSALEKTIVSSDNKKGNSKKSVISTKKRFFNQEQQYIIKDLWRTGIYTFVIIAVLLAIFVYTKTS